MYPDPFRLLQGDFCCQNPSVEIDGKGNDKELEMMKAGLQIGFADLRFRTILRVSKKSE